MERWPVQGRCSKPARSTGNVYSASCLLSDIIRGVIREIVLSFRQTDLYNSDLSTHNEWDFQE